MRMDFGVFQEQSQKLVMTPELRLAIKILQYSAIELAEFIQQEVDENPILEVKEYEVAEDRPDLEPDDSNTGEENYDIDWQDYFADTSDLGYVRNQVGEQENVNYDRFISKAPTLQEHLSFQMSLLDFSEVQRKVGEYLIGNIDEAGYLQVSIAETAQKFSLTTGEIEVVLKAIHGFEPYGIGARNLTESLLIQARHQGLLNTIVKQLIELYLPEMAKGKMVKVAQELGVSVGEVQKAMDIIKKLDPKPGRNFSSANDIRYIIPDIIIERVDGEYIIIINDSSYPRLMINDSYKKILKKDAGDETREFIEQKLNSAMWLVKSIEQRRLTLYKVAQSIVGFQRDFLDKGIRHLKPLNLKQVATEVGVHESTVSRATSNKYAQTPQGVFELKFFFTSGVESQSGSMVSAESIKKSMTDLIEREDSKNPLSDQKICDLLNIQGVKISRRTVAKYRDELGIPAASVRKRYE